MASPPVDETPPGLLIAAPASGSGKTLATLALLRALKRRGTRVASLKVGPDYIDPAFHTAASGRPCLNFDGWAMRAATRAEVLRRLSRDAEVLVGEGVMGLFDGAAGGAGSTAEAARLTGWPVVLVVDAKGMAASAAALLEGFARHDPGVDVAGVIFNRVGGEGHAALLREAAARAGVACLGCLPRDDRLEMPSRHLGLVQAGEHGDLEARIESAADWLAPSVDLDALIAMARPTELAPGQAGPPLPPLGQRIAVARDAAFAFAYDGVLQGWRDAGAEVVPFSPLADAAPDRQADAVYLPGGYPELYADRLAGAQRFLNGLREAARRGAWVFGECGGYMALGRHLIDADGTAHAMAGLLDVETSFAEPRLHLGYRTVKLMVETPFGPAGTRVRGHEFHYARTRHETGRPLARVGDASGRDRGATGLVAGQVMGSFLHLIDRAHDSSGQDTAAPQTAEVGSTAPVAEKGGGGHRQVE
ncbi:cobyrinate a,c-diamide synthase [Rhodovibrio salinarum]|uniref:cobyrinate a,c-diamide synthase n=1 Tax=Rhodovibrio salinarum TaxID=1087 RepID=UPI001FD40F0A|nr:cobyrinate a,c-diamide synthase [Rhodovibrio salinarum]